MKKNFSIQFKLFYCILSFCFSASVLVAPGAFAASATDTTKAASFSGQSGVTTEACSEGGQNATSIEANDHIYFSNMDFGASGIQSFEARVAGYGNGGFIELRLDSPTGTLIGTCEILPPTGGWQTWTNKACHVTGATGTHTLYLVFKGGVGTYLISKLFNLNWFKFHGTPALTTANWRQSITTAKGILKTPLTLSAASGTPVIEIFPDSMFQRVDGWGGAFNENGYHCISSLSDSMRAAVMRDLYDPVIGCRFNIGRVPIGMSDFTVNKVYSLNETAGDYAMTNFSLRNDSLMNIAYVKAAMVANPNIMIHASPWTPPGWMKNTNTWQGGNNPQIIQNAQTWTAYALYFSKFVKGWKQAGISINLVYPQNEPGFNAAGHPSCAWSGTDLKNWIRDYLYPKFVADTITTQIWMGTFNYSDFNSQVAPTLNDPLARTMITGIGSQRDGNGLMLTSSQNSYFRSLHYHGMQTETNCWSGANSWTDAMNTFREIYNHEIANTQSYNMWNMILDADYNYVSWMTRAQNSMITITPATQTVRYNPEFYIMKHWSYYVRVGAVRVYSTNTNAGLRAVAFKNPDGTIILEVQNTSTGTISPMVKMGSKMFTPALLASSVNTFNIGGTENTAAWGGAPVVRQTNPFQRIEAEKFTQASADIMAESCSDAGGGMNIGYTLDSSYIEFDSLDFKAGATACSLRVAAASGAGGTVELRLDSLNGRLLGTATITSTGGWQTYTTISCTVTPVSGAHDLFLVFKTASTFTGNVNWLVFKPVSVAILQPAVSLSSSFPSISNVNGKTIIDLSSQGNYRIAVTGIDGKKVLSLSGNPGSINASTVDNGASHCPIRAGVYLVAVEQNGRRSVEKVINTSNTGLFVIRQ